MSKPIEEEVTPQEVPNEDSFEAAWDEALAAPAAEVDSPEPEAVALDAIPPVLESEPAAVAAPEVPAVQVDEEARKRAANEASMKGRLEAERRKNDELEARLKAAEAQRSAVQTPEQAAQKPRVGMFHEPIRVDAVDADTKTLIEEFAKVNPELAPLLVENSKEGARMRRLLNEFGADYAATAAEMTVKTRQIDMAEAARVSAAQVAVVEGHYATLVREHPEYAEALVGTSDDAITKRNALHADLQAWVNTLPYEQGAFAQRVIQGGTTEQVSFVLGKFKESKAAVAPDPTLAAAAPPSAETQRAATAGFAVPSRGAAPLPRPKPDKNDWDSVWD